ncbi:MAG: extracellular solute-binding protein [Turicibacter sp.]|nr:extracellular solute-binding protein [Turicibacter sp.]
MNFKKWLGVAAAALATTSLAACGQGAGNDGDVVLRMAWWGSQTRHDATVAVIEMFEEQHPGITIEYEFFAPDGYWTAMNTRVASDDVWDIFQMGGNFQQYMDQILDLSPFINDGTIDVSRTNDSFLDTTRFEGKQVGISNGVNANGIAIDPAMFAAAGVAIPTEDWTWDDFTAAALQIHNRLGVYGSSALSDFIATTILITQSGANFFDPATNSTTLGFDDPSKLVPYFEMRRDLVQAGAFPDSGTLATITDIEGDLLVTGEAAMTWVASNQFPTVANAAGRDLLLLPLPRLSRAGDSGMGLTSSQMFSISSSSDHPEEAAKFISFFQNDEEANRILNGERGVPIMSHIRELLQQGADANLIAVYDFVDLAGRLDTRSGNPLESPNNAEIRDNFELLLERVVLGQLTPEEAAQQTFDFAEQVLARN